MTQEEKAIYDAGYKVGYYKGWLYAVKVSVVVVTMIGVFSMLS